MSQLLLPRQLYYRVFVALLGLTLLTVGSCLPRFRVLEYHHRPDHCRRQSGARAPLLHAPALQQRPHLDRLGAGIFWVMLLLTITLSDYLTRSWLPVAGW